MRIVLAESFLVPLSFSSTKLKQDQDNRRCHLHYGCFTDVAVWKSYHVNHDKQLICTRFFILIEI